MSIRDLMEQFTIQGGYQIKRWIDKEGTYIILAEGQEFEYESYKIKDEVLDAKIKYMYAPKMLECIVFEVE